MTKKTLNVDTLKSRGIELANSGQLDAAADVYLNILNSFDRQDTDSLVALGVLSGMRGDYASAERYLEQAAQINPQLSAAYFNLGIAQKYQNKLEAACSSYRKAIACEPGNAAYHNNLGNVLLAMQLPDQAIACFNRALELAPESPDYSYNLGKALKARGLRAKAVTAFEHALSLRPAFTAALRELGSTYLSLGNVPDARNCYRKSLDIDPRDPCAIAGLANTLAHERKYQEAFDLLQPALAGDNVDINIAIAFSAIAPQLGRENAAIQLLEKLLATATDSDNRAQILFRLGALHDRNGNYKTAFDYIREGNKLRSSSTADSLYSASLFPDIAKKFDTDTMSKSAHSNCDSEIPVFIVGMPRSGTSLVEHILAAHPLVHGAGELDTLPDLLGEYPALSGDISTIDPAILDTVADQYLAHIRALAPDATRITDKMPANFQNIGYIRLLFPRARIIHCRRNPIDTCMSCYFQDFAGHLRYTNDLGTLGSYYVEYNRLMQHWEQVLDTAIYTVDYEKLVSDFENECRKLVAYCGLEWDPACLTFFKNERIVVTASANQVNKPLYTGSVGRWLNYRDRLGELIDALGPLAHSSSTQTNNATTEDQTKYKP